jgi:DNA-nicking Smr family endonuclease
MALDLHGLTVHNAWQKYRSHTQLCYFNKVKKTVVITGHGIMAREFIGWVSADPYSIKCERLNPNTGAWRVYIRKSQSTDKKPEPVNLLQLYKKFHPR